MDFFDMIRMGRMAKNGAEAAIISDGNPYVIGYVIVCIALVLVFRFWRYRK